MYFSKILGLLTGRSEEYTLKQRCAQAVLRSIGLLFVVAGLSKAIEGATTTAVIESLHVPHKLAFVGAILLIAVELYVGSGLLLVTSNPRFVRAAKMLLAVFFVFLWYILVFSPGTSCGCGTLLNLVEDSEANALLGMVRNLVLIGLLHWCYQITICKKATAESATA